MNYKRKLIEVALPLEPINEECVKDKERKTGHIRNLHKWFAPMPLPAWRAILLAQLLDDPSEYIKDEVKADKRRKEIFKIIESILPLDEPSNSPNFDRARALLKEQFPKGLPTVVDPFCGGGSTLLEAERLGLSAIGSDLNPIPVLISKLIGEIPSKVREVKKLSLLNGLESPMVGLDCFVDDLKVFSSLVREEAFQILGDLYPAIKVAEGSKKVDAVPVAFLWARSVECPNPSCRVTTPLASTFFIGKDSTGKSKYINPKLEKKEKKIIYEVSDKEPEISPKVGRGTKFKCVACSQAIDEKYLSQQGDAQKIGVTHMMTVVATDSKRHFIGSKDWEKYQKPVPKPKWKPELELSTHPQYMGAPRYGLKRVCDLFTDRQLYSMTVFADVVKELDLNKSKLLKSHDFSNSKVSKEEYSKFIKTALAIFVSKLSQNNNVTVRWKIDSRSGTGKPIPAFDKQTVPMVWDFVETNPFSGAAGDWVEAAVKYGLMAFRFTRVSGSGEVFQSDARSLQYLKEIKGPIVVATDPPYYDNIPYSDLSDVFYPWLREMLREEWPEIFRTIGTPKANELVADVYRFSGSETAAKDAFIQGFKEAFGNLGNVIQPEIPITVIYSFKQQDSVGEDEYVSEGWEAIIEALLGAGFRVTGSWPISTTMQKRSRDIGANAQASALVIVCRKNDPKAQARSVTKREFLAELKDELKEAVSHLKKSNIAPVDLPQSALGPGIAIYSKYKKVLESDDSPMPVRKALSAINQVLDEILNESDAEFDSHTRWALEWLEMYGYEAGSFKDAEKMLRTRNIGMETLTASGVVQSKAGQVRLLRIEEMKLPDEANKTILWVAMAQLIKSLLEDGESVAAEIVSELSANAPLCRDLAYRCFSVCEKKGLAADGTKFSSLVSSWSQLVLLASESKQQPLF